MYITEQNKQQMKNSILYYTNDIYVLRANQHIISQETFVHHAGYANPAIRENAQGAHSYFVEWQISEDAKNMNSQEV